MDDLNKADKKLTKLNDKDVRIVYLPPMTLATIHIIGQDANGEHAEHTAAIIMDEFIKNTNLAKVYPAARNFGFNNPDGVSDDDPNHGCLLHPGPPFWKTVCSAAAAGKT